MAWVVIAEPVLAVPDQFDQNAVGIQASGNFVGTGLEALPQCRIFLQAFRQLPLHFIVPHAERGDLPVVLGIANMRGKTIAIMDLSLAIGGPPIENHRDKFVIVTEYNRNVQGFLVDSVDHIVNMNWEDILPPPKGAAQGTYMTAVTQVEDELVEIIDVEKVLKEVVGGDQEVSEGVIKERTHDLPQHVLMVDDSSVARNQVTRVLSQMGVEFTTATDGQQAVDQLQAWLDEGKDLENWLALVISDVEMPRMDGYSLTRAIREHPKLSHLHVVLHTSLSGVFNSAMVDKVGANDFLPKWEPDTLAMMVQEHLQQHAEERQTAS